MSDPHNNTPDADQLQTFLLERTNVRGAVVTLEQSWREIQTRHPYPDNVRNYLGEALAATVLLGSRIKLDGSLILQTHTSGPLHTLVVQTTSAGTIRGLARWDEASLEGTQNILGDGRLVMTIDNQGAERYQGIVSVEHHQLAVILESYFRQSEQLPTRLWLAADAKRAAGLLVQIVADVEADDKYLQGEEQQAEDWSRTQTLADTITAAELLTLQPLAIVKRLFAQETPRVFAPKEINFSCGCSRERIESMLLGLGAKEVQSIIEQEGKVSIDCEFCNRHYDYDSVDAMKLFVDIDQATVPDTRH